METFKRTEEKKVARQKKLISVMLVKERMPGIDNDSGECRTNLPLILRTGGITPSIGEAKGKFISRINWRRPIGG